ncbi:hypothetical protein FHG66_19640 [Rubellimicrobium rubrum]|uniref:Uncharacterized protein n=1 Tax=Rubellimicrobium rubrum TaxID=2585369 RepID=A0A5C4MQJ5_9RHOB|nr:hypothetical protein [Rubellimicrobium rubrum]TNC46004.1 hypothetical protein FHG66_19640 [Rubellimicrobium rubrum]
MKERRNGGDVHRRLAWTLLIAMLVVLLVLQAVGVMGWSLFDVVVAGALLGVVGCVARLISRSVRGPVYRAATGVALGTAVLLVWSNLAVGLIGSERNPANLVYGGVIVIGLIGAGLARLLPEGMARVMVATALAQVVVPLVALIGGVGVAGPVSMVDVIMVTALFATLWLIAARLFGMAARWSAQERLAA